MENNLLLLSLIRYKFVYLGKENYQVNFTSKCGELYLFVVFSVRVKLLYCYCVPLDFLINVKVTFKSADDMLRNISARVAIVANLIYTVKYFRYLNS